MPYDKPNILLIVTDTQRWDTLQCMGAHHAVSPALDRLAGKGVLFKQAHTSSPVCCPARCSLLTGYHTPVHGCIENGVQRRTDLPVFPDALKEQGYTNIMVGKTHFGPIPESFDVRHILKGEKGTDSDDFYAKHIRSHGFSRSSAYPNPIPPELFMDAFLADTTIAEIEKTRKSGKQPFFAFCSMPSPHSPNDPPGKWADLCEGKPLPEINYVEGEIEGHPRQLRQLVGTLDPAASANEPRLGYKDGPFEHLREAVGNTIENRDRQEIDLYRRLYYGLAAYCDEQIGRILDYLDGSGLRENTLVLFTSDHGAQHFDHGFNDKHNYYDESWHVPFIMSMPGLLPQGESRDFATWNDITATILAAAGANCDWVQGFDLLEPLAAGKPSPRRCAVGSVFRSMALATRRWKLEYYIDEGEGRLYDRLGDPTEHENLYERADYHEVKERLLEALLAWRCDITDIRYLHENTVGGGPVARRVARLVPAMKGSDSEQRLSERLDGVDET